jgi:lysophospholipase L1-like esterase
METAPRPWILRALLATLVAVLLLVAKDWAYVPTFRLFLDHPTASSHSGAAQQFAIEGDRVVPLIVTRGADRVAVATEIGQDATLHAGLRSTGRMAYAIEWHRGAARRVLAHGTVDGASSIACAYPTGTGVIELVSDGAVTWVDPRVVRALPVWPYLWVVGILILCRLAWTRRDPAQQPPSFFGVRTFTLLKVAAATVSLVVALLVSEVMLRALGDRVPGGIAAERHDLGEVNRDPHWIDSPRYGRRLRASVETLNEWRDGDIVRMGFIPSQGQGPLHKFTFHTDAEGFRNPAIRDRFDIAALGDSFTDAMTMAGDASWPARLEGLLGVPVQNYGTAGFGPQQELLVLQDIVAAHRPRTVVLAFFAGNDIFDAEAFDAFQRSGGAIKRPQQGWRIKDVVSRADSWFVVSALRAAGRSLGTHQGTVNAAAPEPAPRIEEPITAPPAFDDGWFDLPVAGRRLRWAFMPPYLNTLNFSRADLTARAGWRLTADAITTMRTVSRSFGADFIVMFVPFKSQVYLPLVEAALPRDQIASAFQFYLERYGGKVDVDRVFANRLAQNELMEQLCQEAGIPFLDLTPALAARVATGENVYFPDESHLNEAGESLVAETLAAFLKAEQKSRSGS